MRLWLQWQERGSPRQRTSRSTHILRMGNPTLSWLTKHCCTLLIRAFDGLSTSESLLLTSLRLIACRWKGKVVKGHHLGWTCSRDRQSDHDRAMLNNAIILPCASALGGWPYDGTTSFKSFFELWGIFTGIITNRALIICPRPQPQPQEPASLVPLNLTSQMPSQLSRTCAPID
jgi:hypothetical protein